MLDPRIAGKENIAEAMRTSGRQIFRWISTKAPPRPIARYYRDPLRVRVLHGTLVIRKSRIEAWKNRNLRDGANERKLFGWPAICDRIGLRKASAILACKRDDDPLPVVRKEGERPWAYASALDEWCEANEHSYSVFLLLSKIGKPITARDVERFSRIEEGENSEAMSVTV